MKKYIAFFLSAAMLLTLAACGSSGAQPESVSAGETPESQESAAASESAVESEDYGDTIDMLYYKDLGDGSIMAACYTDEGIARLGEDFYIVYVDEADIYNASGEQISFEELVRGCPIRITWSGIVTMSLPGQIPAERIDAISDEADPSVPPENEIDIIGRLPILGDTEGFADVPQLIVGYRNSLADASVFISYHNGSWNQTEEEDGMMMAGGTNRLMDGLQPWEWTYNDSNTIVRDGFDTVALDFSPAADTVTVVAYAFDGTEADVELLEVELVDGVLTLLDGDHIYVVTATWDAEEYSGEATYGFLVTAGT